jgi:hypothetical protein
MDFGHFDDQAREYVITRPDTPRPWSNYRHLAEPTRPRQQRYLVADVLSVLLSSAPLFIETP